MTFTNGLKSLFTAKACTNTTIHIQRCTQEIRIAETEVSHESSCLLASYCKLSATISTDVHACVIHPKPIVYQTCWKV